jgi:hypothetical protein
VALERGVDGRVMVNFIVDEIGLFKRYKNSTICGKNIVKRFR